MADGLVPLPRKRGAPPMKGRAIDVRALAEVQAALGEEPRRRDLLIEHLHRLQARFGALFERHLVALAAEMKLAMAEVYEVATFYARFDVVPDGESAPPAITVRVCESLPCALAGSAALYENLRRSCGADIRVLKGPCIGRCAEAPSVEVNEARVDRATMDAVIDAAAVRPARPMVPGYLAFRDYVQSGGYRLLRECLDGRRDAVALIEAMEQSGLRGLGGAGFPVGRKWRTVRGEPGPRLMALNADEGEPGTFKDRYCFERDPHRVLEGMLVAAWVVDAADVYLYLRDEYPAVREILAAELHKIRAAGLDAKTKIHLRRGAGAYICGEESAMLESIEGKRGYPRHKPPFPAQVGLFGRPTLIQNVETMFWVREIVERGPSWWSSLGRNGRKGQRLFSLSGRVKKPGVHLAPAGITVRELIAEYGDGMLDGHSFAAYLPGGASGGILPPSLADVPLDFDTLNPHGSFIGSAAVIVLSDKDDLIGAASNLMRFFEEESCGQCTPCRNGTEKAVAIFDGGTHGGALLEELATCMNDASICGLGQAAPNPLRSLWKHFGVR